MGPPGLPSSGSARSSFQSSFFYTLRSYKNRTREDLLSDPLAATLQSCYSSDAALSVLQEQAQTSLKGWLGSTVDVLYYLSSGFDGVQVGFGLSPAKVIFVSIGVLFSVTQAIHSSQDALIDIFKRMEYLFKELKFYEFPPTKPAKDMAEKIMLAVFSIITTVTEEIKQGRTRNHIKKLPGRNDLEDAFQRLATLTRDMGALKLSRREPVHT